MRMYLVAVVSGVVGVAVSAAAVWLAARAWDSLDQLWSFTGILFPVLAVWGGCALAGYVNPAFQDLPADGARRRGALLGLALLIAAFAALGAHTDYVVIARTWHPDQIDSSPAGFVYQFFHPWTLPVLAETSSTGSSSETPWFLGPILGLFVGFISALRIFRDFRIG